MTKTFAARTAPLALAALLTAAMLLATNALARHQYRVAVAQQWTQLAVLDAQHVAFDAQRRTVA
jgi:hypothetical protein